MKLLRPWNIVWATLFLLACLVIWMPSESRAAKVDADDPGTYGAWGSDPRQGASNGVTIAPFNTKQSEMTSFACVVNGRVLSESVVSALADIGQMSLVIYRGGIDEYSFGGRAEDQEDSTLWAEENYGHPKGMAGVKSFISKEKDWLKKNLQDMDAYMEAARYAAEKGQVLVTKNGPITNPTATQIKAAYPWLNQVSAWSKHDQRSFEGDNEANSDADENDDAQTQNGDPVYYRMKWASEGDNEVWLNMDKNDYRRKFFDRSHTEAFPLTKKEAQLVSSFIVDNPKGPANIFSPDVPDGCIPAVFDAGLETEFGDLLSDPQDFIASILLSPVVDISNAVYQAIHKDAWATLFTTPHTERGDLIWDIDDQCLSDKELVASRNGEDRWTTTSNNPDVCQNNKQLGFSKKNTGENVKDRPIFLDLANLIAWLITGTYFVILFAAAVIFIYRGNKSQKFNLMKVAPRILLSMLVAIAAPFLIGALITASNWATTGIFDMMDSQGSPINSMNIMLSQAGLMMGVENELAQTFILAVVAVITMSVTAVFLVGVVVKQLALIFLIVLAPVAIFCLIVDSWRPKFMRWLKALMILVLIPVIMAVILQLGVLLNPLMKGSVSEGISVFMLIATIAAMGWVMQKGVSIAVRGKNTNVLSGIMQGAGTIVQGSASIARRLPGGWGTAAGTALGVAGQGLRSGGQALDKQDLGDKLAAKLIPEGRAAGGAGAGAHALQRFGRSVSQGAQIGQGRRGVFGRAGRNGYRGSRYGGGGGRGRGGRGGRGKSQEESGFIRRNVHDRMKRRIGRLRQHRDMIKKGRQGDRFMDGKYNFRRPLSVIPKWLGLGKTFSERMQNLNVPGSLAAGAVAATITGAAAKRKFDQVDKLQTSFETKALLEAKTSILKEADRLAAAGKESEAKALRKVARRTRSYEGLRELVDGDSKFSTDSKTAALAMQMGIQFRNKEKQFFTDLHQAEGVIGGRDGMKFDKGNLIIATDSQTAAKIENKNYQ